MTDTSEFEGRRYSGVAVAHASLRSINDFVAAVDRIEISRAKPILDERGVLAVRGDWHHSQNLYPYGSTLRSSTRQPDASGRFRHRCYLAAIAGAGGPPTFVFASPHIRVVGGWSTVLGESVENPRPTYSIPLLDGLFRALGTSAMPYKATQITLQVSSSVDVEKVALTGKSPLISELHASLAPVTRPYAVRLEVPREKRPLRLHLDRHGNYWWHQANDDAFGVAMLALASLLTDRYMGKTHDMPHRRIVSEDSFV